ncbi:MAG: sigma-E factor negative regulatory protein [Pseudomonadota bacterium]
MDDFFARSRLSAYLDGELTDAEMAEVARALEEQPELRQAFEELKAAVDLLHRHGPVQAPARLHAAIMREVEAEPTRRPWLERLLGPLGRYPAQTLGVAVVAAVVLLVVLRGPTVVHPPPDGTAAGGLPVVAGDADHEAAAPDQAPGAGGGQEGTSAEEQAPAGPASTKEAGGAEDEFDAPGTLGSISAEEEPVAKKGRGSVPLEQALDTRKGATYVPGWEQEEIPEREVAKEGAEAPVVEAAGGAGAFAYRLTPSSPDVLRRLVALAEKLDGAAYEVDGAALDPQILTVERNYARVVLRIPASRLESVEPYLKTMGGLVTVRADQEQIYNLDSVEIEIEVQYLP